MKKIVVFLILMCSIGISAALNINAHSEQQLDFYQMFEEHGAIMLLIDAQTGKIEHANQSAADFYGYSLEQLHSMNINEINDIPPEETEAKRLATLAGGENNVIIEQRLANGEIRTVEVYSCSHEQDDNTLIFATIYDITDKVRLDTHNKIIISTIIVVLAVSAVTFGILFFQLNKKSKEIFYLGYHDPLTGLYNRRYFEENLVKTDIADNLPISVIMADVNGLKITNDVFGHDAGDRLLKKAAETMTGACRKGDIIARVGGDEFIVILPDTKLDDARKIADRISEMFSKEHIEVVDGSISMGCDVKNQADEDIRQVIRGAEEKMYAQKTLDRKINGGKTTRAIIDLYNKNLKEKVHAEKVSEISVQIGKAMKLPESEINILETAGLLHDIGKIAIDQNILQKQDGLTDEEINKIKQHPIYGYRILNSSEETAEFARYILSHHERWDGCGYPKGLRGDEIPLLSRIIAAAESYVEMTSSSQSKQEALQKIREHAGIEYAPRIADVLVKMLESDMI